MRRALAVGLALAGTLGLAGCSRSPEPPGGLSTCGAVPEGAHDADLTVSLDAPKRSRVDAELDATIRVRAAKDGAGAEPVRFAGGIPVRLLVVAHDDVVGTYEGPTAGVSVDEPVPAAGLDFPVHAAITACSDTVGATTLPAGHYELVATILRSVDGATHELVTGRRALELTD